MTSLSASSQVFLADVERIQQTVTEASRQLSSGKKFQRASQAPDEVEPVLQIRAERRRLAQIQENLTLAKSDAATADGALAQAVKLMDRARTLAAQGANSTLDSENRQSLANEVASLQEEMVNLSRTAVQGRYIFGGDADLTAPYSLDLASADPTSENGVVKNSTADATREIQDPSGGSFRASLSASEIFDTRKPDGTAADDNVFASLNTLRLALISGDEDAVVDSVTAIRSASTRLNSAEAFYGNVETKITNAQTAASQADTRLATALSAREDADMVAAALTLTQSGQQLQAAFEMRASLPQKTLFDYLG
jgi:flagellar hook-associated protein 3 FlgL